MTFAARSFPVPLSPVSNTVDAGLVEMRWSSARNVSITGASPTIRDSPYGSERDARSERTSRRSAVVSSALATMSAISSRLNGLLA